jgi:hypothetical protein
MKPRFFIFCSPLICTCAVLCASMTAQQSESPHLNGSAVQRACALGGVVVDASTGIPLDQALVTVLLDEGASNAELQNTTILTDALGRFNISDLVPGRYRLRVAAQHHASQSYGASRAGSRGKQILLGQGQHVNNLEIRLVPCGGISGTVTYQQGGPFQARRYESYRSAIVMASVKSERTV